MRRYRLSIGEEEARINHLLRAPRKPSALSKPWRHQLFVSATRRGKPNVDTGGELPLMY
jgi:hypothetical protein